MLGSPVDDPAVTVPRMRQKSLRRFLFQQSEAAPRPKARSYRYNAAAVRSIRCSLRDLLSSRP